MNIELRKYYVISKWDNKQLIEMETRNTDNELFDQCVAFPFILESLSLKLEASGSRVQ